MSLNPVLPLLAFGLILSACGGGGGDASTTDGGSNVAILPPPSNIQVDPHSEQIEIRWNGHSAATGYNVYWSDKDAVTPQNGTRVSATTPPLFITGLTNGKTYYVVVTTVNSAGESGPSVQGQATAAVQRPSQATGVIITPGDAEIDIEWNDQQADASTFTVNWREVGGTGRSDIIEDATSPILLTGVANGVVHSITVTPYNEAGPPFRGVPPTEVMPISPVPGWTRQQLVSAPETRNVAPTGVDINDNGVAAVAWSLGTSGNSDVRVSHNVNGDWSEPEIIEDVSEARWPSVAVTPGNDIFVAYTGGAVIWVRQFSGGVWGDPFRLDKPDAKFAKGLPTLAADEMGNVFAAWRETVGRPGGVGVARQDMLDELWARRYVAGSGIWDDPVLVSASVRGIRSIINLDTGADNRAVLTWVQDTKAFDEYYTVGGERRRVAYASVYDGTGWSPATIVGHNDLGDLDNVYEVSLDVNSSGSAIVLATLSRTPDGETYTKELEAARFDAQLGAWSAPEYVEQQFGYNSVDAAIDDQNGMLATWTLHSNGGIRGSIYEPGPSTWNPAHQLILTYGLSTGSDSDIAKEADGTSVMVWVVSRSAMYVMRSEDGSSNWGDPSILGNNHGQEFRMVMSPNGHIVVVTVDEVIVDSAVYDGVYVTTYTP